MRPNRSHQHAGYVPSVAHRFLFAGDRAGGYIGDPSTLTGLDEQSVMSCISPVRTRGDSVPPAQPFPPDPGRHSEPCCHECDKNDVALGDSATCCTAVSTAARSWKNAVFPCPLRIFTATSFAGSATHAGSGSAISALPVEDASFALAQRAHI